MYRKVMLNWTAFVMFCFTNCFDHEIVVEDLKEEISQQKWTVGAEKQSFQNEILLKITDIYNI